jgi:hypothetical protein
MTTALQTKEQYKDVPVVLDIDSFNLAIELPPVRVRDNELIVESEKLEIRHMYPFTYLDTKMFLCKEDDGSVNIYQLIEE